MLQAWPTLCPSVCAALLCGQPSVNDRPDTPATRLTFTDVTAQAGLDALHTLPPGPPPLSAMSAGAAVADFNNDGWQDIFVLTGGGAPDRLFINNGDGTFSDEAMAWGVANRHLGFGAVAADFNDDGFIDLYATSHGPSGSSLVPDRNLLYLNNGPDESGQFTFREVAQLAGVHSISEAGDGFGCAAGDYDLDGDLDLAVAGWLLTPSVAPGNRLFRNDGVTPDGVPIFTDVTQSAIDIDLSSSRGFSPAFVDMDNDWYPELLWVSDFQTSRYLVNNADATFTDQTLPANVGHDQNGMGNAHGDLNNDGLEDWYVSSVLMDMDPIGYSGNTLYLNLGDHTFVERAQDAGVDDGGWGWGTEILDLDHDQDLDIVETNGWPYFPEFVGEPAKLFLNDGTGERFTEAALHTNFLHTHQGRGLARLDFDNDGDQDILLLAFDGPLTLLRNDLPTSTGDANWIRVFVDTDARADLAPHGIGARVRAITPTADQHRSLDAASRYLASSEISAHFGLADAPSVTIEVEWHDGTLARFPDLAPNQTLHVSAPRPPR
ncbi:MAG: CRTAC1 family protein [Phycisphaerales bacterium JB059]